MNTRFGVPVLFLALVLTGCDGGQDDLETADSSVLDTSSPGMPSTGMPGGMGPMGGMGPGTTGSEWQQHMEALHAAAGDSLQAMIPMHRQRVTGMMEMMDGRMGMAMDSTWMATRESLRRDVDRMRNMPPAEMVDFLEEHVARMQRMLRMPQAAPAQGPAQH